MPTKKDFIATAQILARAMYRAGISVAQKHAVLAIVRDFTDLYTHQNPNFQRSKFLAACGLKEED